MNKLEHWRTIPGFVQVGTLGKTYGVDGELRIRIESGREDDVALCGYLFVDRDGSKVPYAIAGFRQSKDLLISLHTIDDVAKADKLAGREIFLPIDEASETIVAKPSDLEFDYLTGFEVLHDGNSVGVIKEVQEFPQQEMGIVMIGDREIMIPLHSDLILEVDKMGRKVSMVLPDGLLDL